MKRVLAGLACAATLSACSPVALPTPVPFPSAPQPVVASAQNWQSIARDVAASIGRTPEGVEILSPLPPSRFSAAFGNMLAAELATRHVPVVHAPRPGLGVVRFAAEVVEPLRPRTGLAFRDRPSTVAVGGLVEIVLNVAVTVGHADMARISRVYYVPRTDVAEYLPFPVPPSAPHPAPVPRIAAAAPPAELLVIDRYGERTVVVGQPTGAVR